ncbi:DUF2490 domain-containing protein [Pedobacter sp. HMF7647]|uniref:DUF2490 domain-containing protein n=1 Tax=Hufsiella arboris TaxID=2695275 RepID=A0A7K1YAB8_9SPHI|nr:DUF2490 domain-containing protein [Hufsiella arboris]MXV51526.1 DUF2490 domain-containing protein [Hufsiella arboris]
MKNALTTILFLLGTSAVFCQKTETSGWFFLTHTQELNKRFDILADVQARSSDQFKHFNTLLLRTALQYKITKVHALALGYAWKGDWLHENATPSYEFENRIYEQYLAAFDLGKIETNVRLRLEQRFIHQDMKTSFTQRFRTFLSFQIPVFANAGFTEGVYAGLQNELFLNVQNKEKASGSLTDQNRLFGSVGYRFSKSIDAELGYMYWYLKEEDEDFRNNVIQLMITTKF